MLACGCQHKTHWCQLVPAHIIHSWIVEVVRYTSLDVLHVLIPRQEGDLTHNTALADIGVYTLSDILGETWTVAPEYKGLLLLNA